MVYCWAIERVEPDKLDGWLQELDEPLPWQMKADSAVAEQLESDSFMSMMALGDG